MSSFQISETEMNEYGRWCQQKTKDLLLICLCAIVVAFFLLLIFNTGHIAHAVTFTAMSSLVFCIWGIARDLGFFWSLTIVAVEILSILVWHILLGANIFS